MTTKIASLRFGLFTAGLLLAALWTYSNHFDNDFQFDDGHAIVENSYIKNLANIPLFFRDGKTLDSLPQNQTYRPFLVTTFAVDYWLGNGHRPRIYHRTTFLLFLLQAVLMYFLYMRVLLRAQVSPWNQLVAGLAVAWYVLHPANAETINYILSRSDSLSTLFVVLGFVVFQYSRWARKWHLYLLPVALGILTKPTAVMFWPMLFVYVLLFEENLSIPDVFMRQHRRAVFAAIRSTLPALLVCGGLFMFTRVMESDTWTPGGSSRFAYIITQPFVILRYFALMFVPVGLSADTDWGLLSSVWNVRFFVGMFFLLALIAIAIVTSKQQRLRPVAFGIVWFLLALLPTSLVPLAEVTNDHRMFYPFVGGLLGVACGAQRLIERMRGNRVVAMSLTLAAVMILGTYAYATHRRNEIWRNDETLWRDVAEQSPKNGRGLMNYGLALMAKGDYAGAQRYFESALVLLPNYSYLHVNLGILNAANGKPVDAERYFQRGVMLDTGNPKVHYFYAQFLLRQGRVPEAEAAARQALTLASAYGQARDLLMDIYAQQGQYKKQHDLARETTRLAADDPKATAALAAAQVRLDAASAQATAHPTASAFIDLSLRYYENGRFEESIGAAERALALKPDSDLAYNNICAANNDLKRWERAIAAGTKAVELNPANQLARANLDWAKRNLASK